MRNTASCGIEQVGDWKPFSEPAPLQRAHYAESGIQSSAWEYICALHRRVILITPKFSIRCTRKWVSYRLQMWQVEQSSSAESALQTLSVLAPIVGPATLMYYTGVAMLGQTDGPSSLASCLSMACTSHFRGSLSNPFSNNGYCLMLLEKGEISYFDACNQLSSIVHRDVWWKEILFFSFSPQVISLFSEAGAVIISIVVYLYSRW